MTAAQVPAFVALRALLPEVHDDTGLIDDARAVRLALWMIESTAPWPAPAQSVLEEVTAVHRRRAPADDEAWSRLRRAAVVLDADPDPVAVRAGALAEAAAWAMSESHASLTEIYRAALQIHVSRAIEATGWSMADDAQADIILGRLAQGSGLDVPQRHEIPALFAAANPALERRFAAQLAASNKAASVFKAALLQHLQRSMAK